MDNTACGAVWGFPGCTRLQQPRCSIVSRLVNHVIGAVDAQLQRLDYPLRGYCLTQFEQSSREFIMPNDRADGVAEPRGVTRDAIDQRVERLRQRIRLPEERCGKRERKQ